MTDGNPDCGVWNAADREPQLSRTIFSPLSLIAIYRCYVLNVNALHRLVCLNTGPEGGAVGEVGHGT